MCVCDITGGDFFVGNRIVPVVHHSLGEIRRALTIRTGEITDDIAGAVWGFPNVATVNIVGKMKLPAWAVIQKQFGNTAPINVIGLVTASPFLANIISSDDVAQIRKGL